jgi:glycosyltransferase involved in cell wall biosynthesis
VTVAAGTASRERGLDEAAALRALAGRRLLHVVTVPLSLVFFRGQIDFFRGLGMDIEMVAAPGPALDEFARRERIRVHPIPMERRITPFADLVALRRMIALMRARRPDLVHAHTPKGGLLGILAARAVGVPRLYQLRGLPLATARGVRRAVLSVTERIACGLADEVISNSESLRREAIALGLVAPDRIRVLGRGSSNGVDARGRFDPARVPASTRRELRARHRIPEHAPLVLFVGRVVRDKGIPELIEAWRSVSARFPDAHLALVGPFERKDAIPKRVLAELRPERRVHVVGAQRDVAEWYAAADLLVLPTHREGFPNVLLEAGAMGLPVVATRVAGCVDAVVAERTGLLVPVSAPDALASAIARYLADPALRARHGAAARAHVLEHFDPERLWTLQALRYAYWLTRARTEGS